MDKSMEVQMQMRRNVEQMHATADDLADFAKEISKRDRSLRGLTNESIAAKEADDGTDEEEEAREIEEAKEELRRLAAEQVAEAESGGNAGANGGSDGGEKAAKKSKGPLTHAQKYNQWEKYDVEGVVEKMEEREKNEERLRKEVLRLENKRSQAQARKAQLLAESAAEALRQQGNSAFNSARYSDAVELYTQALDHTPRSSVLYANRALALLKLSVHAEAEEDCDTALLLDPAFVKARLRRAQARQALANYDGALEDLEAALEAEPKNGGARKQLQECRQLKAQAAPRRKPVASKLAVEHVAYDPDNDGDAFVMSVAPPPADAPSAATAGVAEAAGADAAGAGEGGAAAAASAATAADALRTERMRNLVSVRADAFPMPSSAADVERTWHSLKRTPEEFAAYARRLSPELVGKIFKHNLPAELLTAFLQAIDAHYLPDHPQLAADTLRALSSVGRFTILVMCLEKADVKAIESIFAKLSAELPDQAAELKKLRSAYT